MRRRAFINADHTFQAEMPVLEQDRVIKADLNKSIEEVESDYFDEKYSLNTLISKLNNLYMEHFIASEGDPNITMYNKLELYYSHQVIAGPVGQRDQRKNMVKYWVESKRKLHHKSPT